MEIRNNPQSDITRSLREGIKQRVDARQSDRTDKARAKEAAVKSNCHTTQLAAEDFAVQNNGVYAPGVGNFANALPDNDGDGIPDPLNNPFTNAPTL